MEFPFEVDSDDEEMAAAKAAVITPTHGPRSADKHATRSVSGDSSDTTELDQYINDVMAGVHVL